LVKKIQNQELKNVDKKDISILKELDQDVRSSFQELGRKTRLSKEVVQYRLKQLEDKKIITAYWALFNLPQGTTIYKILIKNKSLTSQKKNEFVEFVMKQKLVSWFANTEGNFDYVMTCTVNDDKDFAYFLQELFSRFGTYFQEKHILKTTKSSMTNEKYLYPNNEFIYNHEVDVYNYIKDIDEKDNIILRELSLNSRIKFVDLAKKTNLTAEAISQRYKKLIDKINIRYKVRIDMKKLGLSYYHLFVSIQNQDMKKELVSFYTIHSDCNSILHHIGFYDLHLEFILPPDKIQKILEEFSAKFGASVVSYELLNVREEYLLHLLR